MPSKVCNTFFYVKLNSCHRFIEVNGYILVICVPSCFYSALKYPVLLWVRLTRPSPVSPSFFLSLDWPQTIQLPNGKSLSVCMWAEEGVWQSRQGLRFNANAMRCPLQWLRLEHSCWIWSWSCNFILLGFSLIFLLLCALRSRWAEICGAVQIDF